MLRWSGAAESGATNLSAGLRIVVLIVALFLSATIAAPVNADTLDIVVGSKLRRYEGSVLVVDQVGLSGLVAFDAQALTPGIWPGELGDGLPASWQVVVGSNSGVTVREWRACRLLFQTYVEGGGMHVALECTP